MLHTWGTRILKVGLCALSIFCFVAHADPISPTDTYLTPASTSLASDPALAGTIIADDVVPFSLGPIITGSVQSRVVRETVSGKLDFYWRVINDPGSTGSIDQFRIGFFNDSTLDFFYRTDSVGTIAPTFVYSFAAFPGFFNVGFCDLAVIGCGAAAIDPGEESLFFLIRTGATDYDRSAVYDLTSGRLLSDVQSTFSPAVVPAPATLALLGLGLSGLGWSRRKK